MKKSEFTNPVSGSIEQAENLQEFLNLFDERVHDAISHNITEKAGVDGCMMLENLDFWSSKHGKRSALIYGPGCTYNTAREITDALLGDVPSRFQYPKTIYIKP